MAAKTALEADEKRYKKIATEFLNYVKEEDGWTTLHQLQWLFTCDTKKVLCSEKAKLVRRKFGTVRPLRYELENVAKELVKNGVFEQKARTPPAPRTSYCGTVLGTMI